MKKLGINPPRPQRDIDEFNEGPDSEPLFT
jgi:hypothetical protein